MTFALLNRLADRGRQAPVNPTIHYPVNSAEEKQQRIWVFCSTIGELNACLPFIRSMEEIGQLILITDHDCYKESYQKHFPEAYVVELTGRVNDADYLVKRLPPDLFIICEIPALPSDAPCRMSYGLLREAKIAGARIHMVNTWLYGYAPACRMDSLEVRLFRKDYLDAFDTIGVQNEDIRFSLLQAGAKTERIFVAGNMKFDSIGDLNIGPVEETTRAALSHLSESQSPVVVAGCLADIDECYMLFDAIAAIRKARPDIRFIIAPRHPENRQFMESFTERLDQSALSYKLKSQLDSSEPIKNNILILDTFGELKSFYSIATLCYVGCNHNVLEPLALGKYTVVSGEWNSLYPSHPVYQLTREKGLVKHVDGVDSISDVILSRVSSDRSARDESENIRSQLQSLSGAVEKTLNATRLTRQS